MQTQEGTPLIQLENIYKNFGKAQILKGINLHIKEGKNWSSSVLPVQVKAL